MTDQHVKWCKQHDWCIDAWIFPQGVIQVVTYDEQKAFRTFKALREWAGY